MTPRTLIIAEAGVNHNGELAMARALIDAAVAAGADAVKFQTFRAEDLVTRDAGTATYQSQNLGDTQTTQFAMLKRLELAPQDFGTLKAYCDQRQIIFLSTPFDQYSVDLLEPLVDRYKIASGDCTNLPLLAYIATKGKPVILSTGMADLEEVRDAVKCLRAHVPMMTILHCTTNYPCPPADVNLWAMHTLRETFHLPVGYSDHTEGIEIPIAAVALGATVIEKHLTLDHNLPGPDHRASVEPPAFAEMVRSIRAVEQSLGDGVKVPCAAELEIRQVARRSLVFARSLTAGSLVQAHDLHAKRPGTGLAPASLDRIVGRRLAHAVQQDELVALEHFE